MDDEISCERVVGALELLKDTGFLIPSQSATVGRGIRPGLLFQACEIGAHPVTLSLGDVPVRSLFIKEYPQLRNSVVDRPKAVIGRRV